MNVGILHPGAMGAVLAVEAAVPVMWASEGRSPATKDRAAAHGLVDSGSVSDLVATSDMLISVCPPHAAMDVAMQVERLGFEGIYIDANAIAPTTVRDIATCFDRFVDGGIVGPPPTEPGLARLYLAGPYGATVAALWEGSNLDARVLSGAIGSASALKAAYAGWTKGSAALLLAVRAYAKPTGWVRKSLLSGRRRSRASQNGPKARQAESDARRGGLKERWLRSPPRWMTSDSLLGFTKLPARSTVASRISRVLKSSRSMM